MIGIANSGLTKILEFSVAPFVLVGPFLSFPTIERPTCIKTWVALFTFHPPSWLDQVISGTDFGMQSLLFICRLKQLSRNQMAKQTADNQATRVAILRGTGD
ncbi:hypothetical protein AXX12_15935 [Anaerosporomusa subterranea]|uniref:Uncharacterized protein n=1 Tax=Anaerosporomusa subterranea TaxID=1794912 RepID=A0A154BM61_ANASB|nr:hypothetical protein AXX12_15935 [Anaerosporomusa subterranea]